MKHSHFDQKIFSTMGMPWQKLMELNIKTIQRMTFMKPGDLLEMKNPEDFFEKNINMMMQNSHTAINHMRDALHIMESHLSNVSHHAEESAEYVMRQATSVAKNTAKKSMSSAKRAVKKTASNLKATSKAVAKVASKAAPKTTVKKVASKAASKSVAKKVVSKTAPKVTAKAKTNVKTATKAANRPMVQHDKPHVTQSVNPVRHDARPMAAKEKRNVQAKDVGHNMPKVGGMTEKSGIKDLGLLNKGNNFPN